MVLEKIISLLSEIVNLDENDISEKTEFSKDIGIAPIDVAELIIKSEKRFNIEIHDEYVLSFKNVGDLVLYIEEVLNS